MRFGDLEGLTSLPISRVRQQFRHEDVLTVLPVSRDVADRDSLLVATPLKLAVLTSDADSQSDHWMTTWASWDTVRFAGEGDGAPDADPEDYGYAVHVGGLTFHAQLAGPAGQRALRDFVVVAQARRAALTASP
jgi:hypothetical protein